METTNTEVERRAGGVVGRVSLANAPVSYGAFEITVGSNPHVPDAERLLTAVATAGYAGVDLGPVGYLSGGGDLAPRLAEHGLDLAGAYLQLPFSEPEALDASWSELVELLDELDRLPAQVEAPKPTLADAGSAARRRHPGAAAEDRSLGLGEQDWERFRAGLDRVVKACRDRGYEPTLHPHAGTFVEVDWEIRRLVDSTDVGICFDPGHLLIGGVDPIAALDAWQGRVNHFHLKEVRDEVLHRLRAEGAELDRYYAGDVFCRLGEGDGAVAQVIERIAAGGYKGWVVVEQDFIPASGEAMDAAIADQEANFRFLREHGL
jgi:inosose dehydratase